MMHAKPSQYRKRWWATIVRKDITLLSITFLPLLTGCVTAGGVSSYSTQAPTPVEIQNSILLEDSFGDVWDKLVKELVTKFYVINNIDKESRLINLTFTSDSPEQFVTGGKTERVFEQGGVTSRYSYDPAESSSYVYGYSWGAYNNLPEVAIVVRRTSLQGRANIYVAPDEGSTIVTVNCRYVLTVIVSGSYIRKNAFGQVMGSGPLQSESWTASFNTNEPTTVSWGSAVTFQSIGTFENDVLSILK